jgi:signal transduction histidine kinase
MPLKNIEKFFLKTLLQITIVGVFIILISNLWFSPQNYLAITISTTILFSAIISYSLKNKFPLLSIMLISIVVLLSTSYQRYLLPNSSTTLAIVLIIGFLYSVMLKGKIMWIMHAITLLVINSIFVIHSDDIIRAGITYSTLYIIITYAAGFLKFHYDKVHYYLTQTNIELSEKTKEIEAQNEELRQTQDNLNEVNIDLEKIVAERTKKITDQNEILLQYSYNNAHYLRGPVARLLGLAYVYRLENTPQPDFFIEKMVEEATAIDVVVKRINTDLELNPLEGGNNK